MNDFSKIKTHSTPTYCRLAEVAAEAERVQVLEEAQHEAELEKMKTEALLREVEDHTHSPICHPTLITRYINLT